VSVLIDSVNVISIGDRPRPNIRNVTIVRSSPQPKHKHTHTHTVVFLLFWKLSGTIQVSRYQKGKNQEGKTNLDLLEQ